MPRFRCAAREVRCITVEVEAQTEDDANRLFKSGEWDGVVNEHMAETETVECDLDTVEQLPEKGE